MRPVSTFIWQVCLCIAISSCAPHGAKQKAASEAIAKIEKFRGDHHRLPAGLAEIGIRETLEGPIFYQQEDANDYIIWYGKELGESRVYSSNVGQWQ